MSNRLDELDGLVQITVGEVSDLSTNALVGAVLLLAVLAVEVESEQLAANDDGLALCLLI